jgi:serine/threonine-protein phosphatase 2B catalytic subunit
VYYRFILCFECLPLCALIQTSYGRLFACHGGISPDIRTLDQIEAIDRFTEPDCKGALCDILWCVRACVGWIRGRAWVS